MITFHRERLFDVIEEVDDLLKQHYEELTLNKDRIVLNPMWEEYSALEKMGRFVIFTARDNGKLIGYSAFFTVRHLHYADTMIAINDVLYLDKEYRRGRAGIKLLQFAENELRAMKCDKISYHIKYSLDWSAILHRMGYADEEKVVGKML